MNLPRLFPIVAAAALIYVCADATPDLQNAGYLYLRESVVARFKGTRPNEWSERASGVLTSFTAHEPAVAFTLDACGSRGKNLYDKELLDLFIRERIPVTLFVTGKWIDLDSDVLRDLAKNPLIEIENHGLLHRTCSAKGFSVFGLPSTKSVADIVDEVELGSRKIERITGTRPLFFRAAGAFTDNVCPEVAEALGYRIVSFTVAADGGATYSRERIKREILAAPQGSIILLHMNHPEKKMAEGVAESLPVLRERGMHFVKLSAVPGSTP